MSAVSYEQLTYREVNRINAKIVDQVKVSDARKDVRWI